MTGDSGLRFHRTLKGQGRVYDGERVLVEVDYLLKEVEEASTRVPFGGETPEAVEGRRGVYGVAKTPGSVVLGGYVGTRLTLELQDGRRLDVTVAKVMEVGAFLIQGLSSFR